MGLQNDGRGGVRRFNPVMAGRLSVIAESGGLDHAAFGDVDSRESKEKAALRFFADAGLPSVDRKEHLLYGIAADAVDRLMPGITDFRFLCFLPEPAVEPFFPGAVIPAVRGRIIPVPQQLHGRRRAVHHTEHIKALLPDPDRVHPSAHAAVFAEALPAMLGGISPAQGRAGAVQVFARCAADPVKEKLAVSAGIGQRQILTGQIIKIQPLLLPAALSEITVAVIKIRRRIIIPDPPRGLLPAIFGFGHRAVFRQEAGGMPVQHGSRVFALMQRLLGVDGAAAHKPAGMRIQPLPEQPHLPHVLRRNHIVSGFPEQDGRMVAIGDDHIAHQFHPLIPLAAGRFPLLIPGRLGTHHALPVTGPDIHRAGSHMHPPDMIGPAFTDPACVQIVHPFGHNPAGRPFIGGPLGVAPQPDRAAVDQDPAVPVIAHLPEARLDLQRIGEVFIGRQFDFHPVQSRPGGLPESEPGYRGGKADLPGGGRFQAGRLHLILVRREIVGGFFIPSVGVLRYQRQRRLPGSSRNLHGI